MIKELSIANQSMEKASPQAIAAFQKKYGLRLPPAFLEFCTKWNGGFPDPRNSFYYVPKSFKEFYEQSGPDGKGVTVDGFYGIGRDGDAYDLEKEYLSIAEISVIGLIPIASDLLCNYVVIRADSPFGSVFWWEHGLWEAPEQLRSTPMEAPGRPYLVPIADNLEGFYNSLTINPYTEEL
jgi:hypothetical protein